MTLGVELGRSDRVIGLGIDIERIVDDRAAKAIESVCLTDYERARSPRACESKRRLYATCVFSAKESLFKCLSPIVQTAIDFTDMQVLDIRDVPGVMRLALTRDLSRRVNQNHVFRVTVRVVDKFIFTAIELDAHSSWVESNR